MQTMETTAPTKVIYGVNELDLDLAGKTVRGIWKALVPDHIYHVNEPHA